MVKKHVSNYWEAHFRNEAVDLPSLQFFKPEFLSQASIHPIFSSAGPSSYQVTSDHGDLVIVQA